MEFQPLGKRIMIKEIMLEEKTKSGIVLPDSYKEGSNLGTVLAMGSKIEEPELKVEDVVLFNRHSGTKVTVGQEDYLIIDEEDILAISYL